MLAEVNKIQVTHFFHAFKDSNSRFDLAHNMLVLANLLYDFDCKANGISNPDMWLLLRAERGSYVFFAGLIDLLSVEASFTTKSNHSYCHNGVTFPNAAPGSMYAKIALYAMALTRGFFLHQVSDK